MVIILFVNKMATLIRYNTGIAQSRTLGIFIRDTAYFIVIQVWSYASPNHDRICRIPYENASRTGLQNLCNKDRTTGVMFNIMK